MFKHMVVNWDCTYKIKVVLKRSGMSHWDNWHSFSWNWKAFSFSFYFSMVWPQQAHIISKLQYKSKVFSFRWMGRLKTILSFIPIQQAKESMIGLWFWCSTCSPPSLFHAAVVCGHIRVVNKGPGHAWLPSVLPPFEVPLSKASHIVLQQIRLDICSQSQCMKSPTLSSPSYVSLSLFWWT